MAELNSSSPGQFSLAGELSFTTVPQLASRGDELFQNDSDVSLDLAAVERSDSAGLALLVSWVRLARQKKGSIKYLNVPEQLQVLARVSGVEAILAWSNHSS
jgi:phospholipid transport system transporter-binding protein